MPQSMRNAGLLPLKYMSMSTLWRRVLPLRLAIDAAVKTGDKILDAGCGPFGLLGMIALKAGGEKLVAVDYQSVEMARMIAQDNGFAERCSFIRGDLRTVVLREKFDVILAMIYNNHPRTDERQSKIVMRLRDQCLAANGRVVPNIVRYYAYGCDWPSQDLPTRNALLSHQVAYLEGAIGLSLAPLKVRLMDEIPYDTPTEHSNNLPIFPARDNFGRLPKDGSRVLSPVSKVMEVDYDSGSMTYPASHPLEITSDGIINAIIWIQELWFENMLIFSNESVSWVRQPCKVKLGDRLEIKLDDAWRKTNTVSAEAL